MTDSTKPIAILVDVDGTLVDSNDAHARAWVEAFEEFGVHVDYAHVRRCIGMGGDKLMPEVSTLREDTPKGHAISERRREIFKTKHLPRLKSFAGARELIAALNERGYTIVAASSAKKDELHALLKVADVDALLDSATSSDDANESKPDPDIVRAALTRAKASAAEATMIGDTPYDIEAALRAGVRVIAFRSGGWGDADLKGAVAIYDGPADLRSKLDESILA